MEVENSEVDMEDVVRLLDLYRLAIEHFETCKDDKYLIFKNKT